MGQTGIPDSYLDNVAMIFSMASPARAMAWPCWSPVGILRWCDRLPVVMKQRHTLVE